MIPEGLYIWSLRNLMTGREAKVAACTLDAACKALSWFNSDVRMTGCQTVEAIVIDKDEPSSIVYKPMKGSA